MSRLAKQEKLSAAPKEVHSKEILDEPMMKQTKDMNKNNDIKKSAQAESDEAVQQPVPMEATPRTHLKSCLEKSEHEHPRTSILVHNDAISPTMHGLAKIGSTPGSSTVSPNGFFTGSPAISIKEDSAPGSIISSCHASPELAPSSLSKINLKYGTNGIEDMISSAMPTSSDETRSKLHLLIGITGSISIHKNIFLIIGKLFELYTRNRLEIQVILTKAAEMILYDKLFKFEKLGVKVWFHDDHMKYYLSAKSSTKNHALYCLTYEIQRWTDVLLLSPLSANTVAKLINGLADNLLTDLLHIWPTAHLNPPQQKLSQPQNSTVLSNNFVSPKPIVVALAYTEAMYAHSLTKRQLISLQECFPGICILKPVEKYCDVDGNISMGGMRSWREVVDFVVQKLGEPPINEDDEDNEEGNSERDSTNDAKNISDEADEDEDEDEDEGEFENENDNGSGGKTSATRPKGKAREEYQLERQSPSDGERKAIDLQPRSSRSDTISARELQEHEKLASKNAILNSVPSFSSVYSSSS
ncbi:uncharacterized protein PRCAT00000911001 [Priceomyces carsonii]|uniref:uncharacterized protein n=1 Tax=Priceomyces carsonii TaxID=28549 RepID=UPI002ED7BACC|nr:unnamed protein product [Priceomyces carsonii]